MGARRAGVGSEALRSLRARIAARGVLPVLVAFLALASCADAPTVPIWRKVYLTRAEAAALMSLSESEFEGLVRLDLPIGATPMPRPRWGGTGHPRWSRAMLEKWSGRTF